MNKILTLIVCILLATGTVFAAPPSNSLKLGITQYKSGNYIGCSETMQKVVRSDPGNIIAHYYLAIANVQIGKREDAVREYNSVLALDPNSTLSYYSRIGLQHLGVEAPAQGQPQGGSTPASPSSLPTFVPPVSGNSALNFMSGKAKEAVINSNLNNVVDTVNKNGSVDTSKLKKIDEYTRNKSDNSDVDEITPSNTVPNKEQIAQALETLQKAGLSPSTASNPYQNINPEMLQMQMLMSSMGGNSGNMSNNSMNMLPLLMLSQNSNSSAKMDPQLIENMVTGMMIPNMSSLNNSNNND